MADQEYHINIPVLWPEMMPVKISVSPHAILSRQAQWITDYTKGRVIGMVCSKNMGRSLSHTFSLTCPCLINYSYFLIRIRHAIDQFYPAQVFLSDNEGSIIECDNEEKFLLTLKSILDDQQLHRVIETLMSHEINPVDPNLQPDVSV